MSNEGWGLRDRRRGGRGNGREVDRGERGKRWGNRFEVLDRTGEVDDSQIIGEHSTPIRRERTTDWNDDVVQEMETQSDNRTGNANGGRNTTDERVEEERGENTGNARGTEGEEEQARRKDSGREVT
jgi:hypothetical protein